MTGFVLLVFMQPVLPELPPPSELEPPSQRPTVVPLEYDTLGIAMQLGSSYGFCLLARNDGPVLAERGRLALTERNDHFKGMERFAYLDVAGTLRAFQSFASFQVYSFETSSSRNYVNPSIASLWHNANLLVAARLQGYASTMSGEDRRGADLSAKVFWGIPTIRILERNQARLDPRGFSFISDFTMQSQLGFLLITSGLEVAILPEKENLFRPGAGLDLLAVLGNFTIDLDGHYQQTTPYIPDTLLLAPVQASISGDVTSCVFSDRIQVKLGYRGVDFTVFAERGRQPFWELDTISALPELQMQEFSRGGTEVHLALEHGYFSNFGSLRVFLTGVNTSWTPLWELNDSLNVRWSDWGGFFNVSAAGERRSRDTNEQPYVMVGIGFFYEKEPFRLLLRTDDLFDRRPLFWPGVPGPGRRVSLSLSLFSTKL